MQHGQPYSTRRALAGVVALCVVLVLVAAISSLGSDDEPTVLAGSGSSTSSTRRVTTSVSTSVTSSTTTATTAATRAPATATTKRPTTTTKPAPKPTATTTATTAPPPSVTTTRAPGTCHPSYLPCLSEQGDYDCPGEPGANGPNYVQGVVEVDEPDEYGLDPDGDGVGCTSPPEATTTSVA